MGMLGSNSVGMDDEESNTGRKTAAGDPMYQGGGADDAATTFPSAEAREETQHKLDAGALFVLKSKGAHLIRILYIYTASCINSFRFISWSMKHTVNRSQR